MSAGKVRGSVSRANKTFFAFRGRHWVDIWQLISVTIPLKALVSPLRGFPPRTRLLMHAEP